MANENNNINAVENFEEVCQVRLLMYNSFSKSYFCVWEGQESIVVPPSKKHWDGKTFSLKYSYEEDGKTFLIYIPA